MAIYLIDGDNNPPFGTNGVQWLKEEDKVIVFYNNSNTFYKLEKHKNELVNGTKAAVQFELISTAKN